MFRGITGSNKWMALGLSAVCGVLALTASLAAQRIDCTAAKSDAEKLVCATPSLRALDDEVGSLYAAALKAASSPGSVVQAQFAMAQLREKCLKESDAQQVPCVAEVYRGRIGVLRKAVPDAAKNEPDKPASEPTQAAPVQPAYLPPPPTQPAGGQPAPETARPVESRQTPPTVTARDLIAEQNARTTSQPPKEDPVVGFLSYLLSTRVGTWFLIGYVIVSTILGFVVIAPWIEKWEGQPKVYIGESSAQILGLKYRDNMQMLGVFLIAAALVGCLGGNLYGGFLLYRHRKQQAGGGTAA